MCGGLTDVLTASLLLSDVNQSAASVKENVYRLLDSDLAIII